MAMMKFKTFLNHIGQALKSLKRNGWMSIAAISAVTLTLLLVGSLIAILLNVNKLASDVENDVSVRVHIDMSADEAAQENLKVHIESIEDVDSVELSTKEDELQNIVGSYGEEFTLFEGDENPLYDVFIVNTYEPAQTTDVAEEISTMDYVANVNYGGATADHLFNVTNSIRNVGIFIIIALLLTAILLISNTIRITITARKQEIQIQRLVGATNWFIRWPFLIEGALIGLIGALIPIGIISALYLNVFQRMMNYLSGTYFSLLSPSPYLFYIWDILLIIGIGIGAFGSVISISRFLKN